MTMNINEIFRKNVKERRINLHLSQEKLANLADIDRTYLPEIERGVRNVSLNIAEKIAIALDVELSDLIKKQ